MLCRLSAFYHATNQATESDRFANGTEIPKTRENTTVGAVSLCDRSQHVVTSSAGLRSHHHSNVVFISPSSNIFGLLQSSDLF
jgi:hypothetical protein